MATGWQSNRGNSGHPRATGWYLPIGLSFDSYLIAFCGAESVVGINEFFSWDICDSLKSCRSSTAYRPCALAMDIISTPAVRLQVGANGSRVRKVIVNQEVVPMMNQTKP